MTATARNFINADGIAQIVETTPRSTLKLGMTEDRRNLRLIAKLNPFEGCLDAPELVPAGGTIMGYTLFGAYQSAYVFRD
ncbi:MAG: hypothetical protein RL456_1948 [Pseudomonadota bacterium]|jgi:hypothetical protein